MATTYYQPGVYIQETDAPATSVTSVPTAIPAFIGYTAMAQAVAPNDLLFVPTQINSLVEYVQYYGTGPAPTVYSVNLDSNYNFIEADVEITYKMFQSVSMFFENGGSTAYIVSVGLYTASPFTHSTADFLGNGTPTDPGAFIPLARLQEPTLIVMPDIMLFAPSHANNFSYITDWATLYQAALQQCATVQSTFLILDFYYNAQLLNGKLEFIYRYSDNTVLNPVAYNYQNEVNAFRENIGINNLNYGAAYGPFVDIMSPTPITYAELYSEGADIYVGGALVSNLSSLASSGTVLQTAEKVEALLADENTIQSSTNGIIQSVENNSTILNETLFPEGSLVTATSLNLPSGISDLGVLYNFIKQLTTGNSISGVEGIEYIFNLAYSIASTVQQFTTSLTESDLILYVNNPTTGIVVTNLVSLYDQVVQIEYAISGATSPANPISLSTWSYTGTGYTTPLLTCVGGQTTIYFSITGIGVIGSWTGPLTAITAGDTVAAFLTALNGEVSGGTWTYTPGWKVIFNAGTLNVTGPLVAGSWGTVNMYTASGQSNFSTTNQIPLGGSTTTVYNAYVPQLSLSGLSTNSPAIWLVPNKTYTPFGDTNPASISWSATSTSTNVTTVLQALDPLMLQIIAQYNSILPWAQSTEAAMEVNLATIFPAFANIINGVNSTPIPFPPSGAMAGVYANIDNTVGVWKAPANTSINGIVGPDWAFDSVNYDDMNVDLQAGKSINAIRTFTGRGTLVWGARTLAGNDIHWRYVPVRRFFIMVEQSIKLALNAYVFEPNSATTWTTVISEVTAYLYDQWRAGALQGATPQQAFSVQCGLGSTMTQADILNGNMIVQIGMAVVRPAEFIILQFSQTVQPGNSN